MTIKDQIRDEKLQYDITSEDAKISALSSDKIHKYEYLTGEEILPSNQQQIIEQAKFTYSPSGKAFIEDQVKKQFDAKRNKRIRKRKEIKPRKTKSKEYGDYFFDALAKLRESFKSVYFNDVTYKFKDLRIQPVSFIRFKDSLHIFKSIHNGDIPLEDAEKEQIDLKRDLGRIKQGDPRNKSKEQKKTIDNINNLHKSREEVVKMFNDYAKNMSRNIYDSKQEGTGLKILTPKQMLQRLPIALAQVKAGNNLQSLLNDIMQIVYSLYQSKEISKKVYNNIIKSIEI